MYGMTPWYNNKLSSDVNLILVGSYYIFTTRAGVGKLWQFQVCFMGHKDSFQ